MAFYKQDIVDINLNTGNIFRSFLPHSIGYKDDDADRFGIRAFRDGEPVDLSGVSCQAIFMNPNGTNIALTSYGTVSGNVAYVTLPPACYDYEGQFCLAIKLVGGGVTGTVRIVDGTVTRTGASGAVAPTSSVPTYQEILSTYDAMVAATSAANLAIAETFDATKAYPAGKYVINEGHLYRLTADHAANVTWANTSKVATNFGDDLSSLKSAMKSYITDYKTVMYGDEVSFSTGEQVQESNKRILLDGTVDDSDAYTIWKINMSDKYAYRIYMHPGGDYALIRFIQLEDYDGNVVAWIKAESGDYQTKYIAGFNGVCKISHRNYYAGNNKKFETDLSLAITKIENGECKNLIGTEPNKLYYGHIPAGRKFTISTYDGNPPSSTITLKYYAKDKTYLDYWSLSTSQSSRTVSDNNEIYWWAFDKELPTKIQLEINSEKTSFEEHYDNERTIENDINTGKYEFYKKASDFSSGYEINTYTGEKTANSNYRYIENVPVTPGQKIYFNGRFGSIYPGIAGYDKNGSYLKAVYNNSAIPDYDDSQITYQGKDVVIPDGVFFISYSTRYDGSYGYLIYSYKDKNRGYYESTFEQEGTLYDAEVQDTVEKYEACLSSSGSLMLTFALFTDLHHDPKYPNDPTNDMFKNISTLNKYVNFDALFNLGDAIDGQFSTKYRAETLLKDVYDLEKDITPFNYNLLGNHDDNIQSTWPDRGNLPASNQLTNLEFASISNKNNRNIIRNANRPTDYYIDFDEYGIRVVVISPQYVTYVSATQTWLNEEALVTDKKVIVLSHCATKAKWGYNNDITNGAIIESALTTFVNNGGDLIVYIHGHTHGDLIETDSDISWTEVSVGCAMFENFTPSPAFPEGLVVPTRNKDNYTKILFDLVCVDLANRKVKFIRCGAGNDYEVSF